MSNNHGLYISGLTMCEHHYNNYHFCRGNSSKKKSRFGFIEEGSGTYTYINRQVSVKQGDIVFIPQNIFCYSEWHGNPDIKVTYLNCFINSHSARYHIQKLDSNKAAQESLLAISRLLDGNLSNELMAYSEFYKLLCEFIPQLENLPMKYDSILNKAINYISDHWNENFTVSDIAKECCVCESKIYQLFRECLGESPITYLNSIKINYALQYLEKGTYSIAEICRLTNFHSENHFRKVFSSITGMTPLKYKKSISS